MDPKVTAISKALTGRLPLENTTTVEGVVLIGLADHGPRMIPVTVDTLEYASEIFGVDSQLTNAYSEIIRVVGGGEVTLIKINGIHPEVTIESKIALIGLDARTHDESDHLSAFVETLGDIRQLVVMSGSSLYRKTYCLDGNTIKRLEMEINKDAYSGISPVCAIALVDDDADILSDEFYSFSHGDSETDLSSVDIYDRIDCILNGLLSSPAQQVGVLIGDMLKAIPDRGFIYNLLSDFAENQLSKSQPCILTGGISLECDPASLYNDLIALAVGEREHLRMSEFINLVISKVSITEGIARFNSNGVPTYCGLIATTPAASSTTGKAYLQVSPYYPSLSQREIEDALDWIANPPEEESEQSQPSDETMQLVVRFDGLTPSYIAALKLDKFTGLINGIDESKLTPNDLADLREELVEAGISENEIETVDSLGFVTLLQRDQNTAIVRRGTNLLYGTGGDYLFDSNTEEWATKPASMGLVSNVRLIQSVGRSLDSKLRGLPEHDINPIKIGALIDETLVDFNNIVRNYEYEIELENETREISYQLGGNTYETTRPAFSDAYRVDLNLTPYGDIEKIRFSVYM